MFKLTSNSIISLLLLLLITLTSCISITNNTNTEKYPTLLNNVPGKLVFVGIPLSTKKGLDSTGEHTYWEYNIPTRTYTMLDANSPVIGQEGFKERVSYYICNRDKQKLLATREPLIYELIKICKNASEHSAAKDLYFREKLGLKDNDNIVSPAGWYTITSDHINKTITIKNKFAKAPFVIKFDNDFCCQTLSHDSNYLVLLEHTGVSNNFSIKNQTYKIRFINIVTGQVYSTENDKIVLPIALEWVK